MAKTQAKTQTYYVCENCGKKSLKYMGKCPACGEWNTMEEVVEKPEPAPTSRNVAATALRSTPQRLREVSVVGGTPAYLVNDETEINADWLKDAKVVGVTAGASAPEELVIRVLEHLRMLGANDYEEQQGGDENVHFALPQEVLHPERLLVQINIEAR